MMVLMMVVVYWFGDGGGSGVGSVDDVGSGGVLETVMMVVVRDRAVRTIFHSLGHLGSDPTPLMGASPTNSQNHLPCASRMPLQ